MTKDNYTKEKKEFDKKFECDCGMKGKHYAFDMGGDEVWNWHIKSLQKREKEIVEEIKRLKKIEYYKFYIGKGVADRKYKVYLKTEIDAYVDEILTHLKK